jgi:membrane protease YdiL (CAAX protease family)
MTMTKRASRITWGFLLGIILLEGWAVLASFRAHGNFAAALLRYASTPPGTALSWGMAVLVTIAYAAYAASASPFIRDHMLRPERWRPYAWIRIVAVPMALISGFFEEAFFRKALMDYAMHRGAGIIVQIAITATVFGAAHAIWGLVGGSVRGALGAMAATGILGGALGVIYIVGGRSIGPCMAAHIAINLLIEPWLILAAATHNWRQRISDA